MPTVYLSEYAPPSWLIEETELLFELGVKDPEGILAVLVSSSLSLRANHLGQETDLFLHGENLKLVAVFLNDTPLALSEVLFEEGGLKIPRTLLQGLTSFRLKLVSYCYPEQNTSLTGLYKTAGLYCTQCEAEGFRRITWYSDRPDVLSRFKVRIEADVETCPVLLANGNLKEQGALEGGRHFAVWEDPFPKPSYLFAVVAGDLGVKRDTFLTRSKRLVELCLYVVPGKEDLCDFAMDCLKKAMAWDEVIFGREYDLDLFMIVAVPDFNMGAMENKGLNIFNDKYILSSKETATDQDYANILSIVAHEYFHNWTGNRITCRDWFQLCLKEGLTVFRDQNFSIDQHLGSVQRILDVQALRQVQFPEDQGPLKHPVRPSSYLEINNFYTATVYEKGAEICRMIHTILGAHLFFRGMDLYFSRYDGQAVTIEDFINCFAEVSGRDFSQFFKWYEVPGTPNVTLSTTYHPQTQTLELKVRQEGSICLHIPLRVALLESENGAEISETLLELRETEQTFSFQSLKSRPIVSFNRGFSAPILLETDHSPQEWLFLIQHDRDSFNRFEASQTIAKMLLLQSLAQKEEENPPIASPLMGDFCKTLKRILENFSHKKEDPALLSLLLDVPSVQEMILWEKQNVNPVWVYYVRRAFQKEMGQALMPDLEQVYALFFAQRQPYTFDSTSCAQRLLAFRLLSLLAQAFPESTDQQAFTLFEQASSMTETMAALQVLVFLPGVLREKALDQFFTRFSNNHLLLDKWFALHAQIPDPEAVGHIRRLLAHPAFDFERPNRVRALVGTFCGQNIAGFHRADGEGYRFLGEVILELDQKNPQIAARLCGAFKNISCLEPVRKAHCQTVLQDILKHPSLSRDVLDMVQRLLSTG